MGFRSLLGLGSKSSDSNSNETSLPSLSDDMPAALPDSQKWQGNLPCVHSATDGCIAHNPTQTAIFFDSSLFVGPNASNYLKPGANKKSDDPLDPNHVIPTLEGIITLPKTTDSLAMIPRVHKNCAFSLSFYHVHAVMQNFSLADSLLSCRVTTGSNPPVLHWCTTPLIQRPNVIDPDDKSSGSNLLLNYSLAFGLKADLGSWSEAPTSHGRAVSKEGLFGSGYREFTPCPHQQISFTSHKGEGKNHTRYAAVHFTRKILKPGTSSSSSSSSSKPKWDEEKCEWKSEEDREIEPMFCERCFTDSYIDIVMVPGGGVVVTVNLFKDLGEGKHWADERWVSLARGVDLKIPRGKDDFGRMKKVYVENGLAL